MNRLTHHDSPPPAVTIEYIDPLEGFRGWLVIDQTSHRLCAGGMRVQAGLTRAHLGDMARNMTMKMRLCGLPIDGAKCGIDYDPNAPGKLAAMSRFIKAIAPYLRDRFSMGPDLNTEMGQLDTIARAFGIPSIKMAIAKAMEFELDYFLARYAILKETALPGWPLGRLRAGYGVAMAALATLDELGIAHQEATVAIQGFGSLAKATAVGLLQAGVRIVALADAQQCLLAPPGGQLDCQQLLQTPGTLLPPPGAGNGSPIVAASAAIHGVSADLLIPAAIENTITKNNAPTLRVKAIVPGANLAVSPGAEALLTNRGVIVLPCFMAGCGGSLSMNGLFGPTEHPTPSAVLDHIQEAMAYMVKKVLARGRREGLTPTAAALLFCREEQPQPEAKPYLLRHRCCNYLTPCDNRP